MKKVFKRKKKKKYKIKCMKEEKTREKRRKKTKEGPKGYPSREGPNNCFFYKRNGKRNRNGIEAQKKKNRF